MSQKTTISLPMLWVFGSANCGAYHRAPAYAALLSLADKNGMVMESNDRIAALTNLSLSSFKNALYFFRDNGYVQIAPHLTRENPHIHNRYTLKPIEGERVCIPVEALRAPLRPCAFIVYCYSLWHFQKYNKTPSGMQTSEGAGLSIGSVYHMRQQIRRANLSITFKPE